MRKITNRIGPLGATGALGTAAGESGVDVGHPPSRMSSFCDIEACVVVWDLDGYVAVQDPDDPSWTRIVPETSVAPLHGHNAIGNLHDPHTMLIFEKTVTAAWIEGVKAGEFDDLVGTSEP